MADIFIENKDLKAGINFHGAELVNLVSVKDDKEHMWSGDAKYWGRVSPVLFPFVGKLYNQTYRYNNVEYNNIPQHGFARDCEFTLIEKGEDYVWLKMEKSELAKEKYPFEYDFHIGYRLEQNEIHVMWKVVNLGKDKLHFSIGAHPAFMCPDMDNEKKYFISFNKELEAVNTGILTGQGVLGSDTSVVKLQDNLLELSQELFAQDALIIDSNDLSEVTLLDSEKNQLISVKFNTPQLGIWSPAGKNAPFVCIEPWYGRCDREGFADSLENREYGNVIDSLSNFEKEYVIKVF